MNNNRHKLKPWQQKLYNIIYESDTIQGKVFDLMLLLAIILSVVVVMMESVQSLQRDFGKLFRTAEWVFTILFSIEYIARIISVPNSKKYAFSFLGIIDLLSVLPSYLSIVFYGAHSLIVLRAIRFIRIFRILKLTQYLGEANVLATALKASRHKITVFLVAVFSIVLILGTLMYLIESPNNGFTSIPISIYWAIVTLTTVGYGDIAPATILGKTLASVIMIMGYGIIAVPTGIVTAEITSMKNKEQKNSRCFNCGLEGHDMDATFCKRCGTELV